MLERIEIDTSELPYKINRTKPTFLETYFQEDSQWTTFCDGIDEELEPFESIRARWMAISVGFTLIQLGILIAIILRYMGVLDDDSGNGAYILFIVAVLSLGLEYYLIKAFAVKPLKTIEDTIDDYCIKTTEQWHNVGFKFEQSNSRSICWDSEKISAWINVAIDDTVA